GSKLNRLAQTMAIHPLVMEDIMRPNQRAKFENYGQQNFFITQRLHGTALQFEMEQFALIWEPGLVISFRERDDESLKTIAQRLTKPGSRMAGSGSDYLVYALIDLVVDHCFPIFEGIGDALDQLEDEVLNDSKPTHTAQAHESRRHIQSLLHMVRPLRDACLQLTRNDHNQLSQVTQTYMRDCYEHCVQLLEILEVYREICQGIQEIYYAVQGQKLNENMRVLTVFASIFIPLTFITGIYGMNFDTSSPYNMPELSWKYGYFGLLGFLFTVTVLLLIYFSRRKWF
ncbi:MAG: magnesium/cobalt transporter CorA, partial [Acidobacteria bacterium]|nr:magnesium/cobalt transporter CorA [Acidobacteriota bacterium]